MCCVRCDKPTSIRLWRKSSVVKQRHPRSKTPASEEGGPRPETSERHTGAGSEEDRFVFDQHRGSCLYRARRTIKQSSQALPNATVCIGTQELRCRQRDKPSVPSSGLTRTRARAPGTAGEAARLSYSVPGSHLPYLGPDSPLKKRFRRGRLLSSGRRSHDQLSPKGVLSRPCH